MIIKSDLHTVQASETLTFSADDAAGKPTGKAHTTYEVRELTDVRNLKSKRSYLVTCVQRLVVANPTGFKYSTATDNKFDNYPAALSSRFTLASSTSGGELGTTLLKYHPRTINAAISTSASNSDSDSASANHQHTTGSSTSQTNSFSVSTSAGFFGFDGTGSVSVDKSHSTTNERNRSDSSGSESSVANTRDVGASMTIKDWAGYVRLDDSCTVPTWIWGQEYPWDVLEYRYSPRGDEGMDMPSFVVERMFDDPDSPLMAFPPSHLSLFGVDFTMSATWQIDLPDDIDHQCVTISHDASCVTASHGINESEGGKSTYVLLNFPPKRTSFSSPELDLTLLGLDPVTSGSASNGAVVGFISSKFTVPPVSGSRFKILSDANNLQVAGEGFSGPMTTDFSSPSVQLTINFKIIDDTIAYGLFMKHWIAEGEGCLLEFTFNGGESITHRVSSKEGEGGEDNLTAIAMRNHDYTSIDFHDYLVMGLNEVVVTITPLGADEGTAKYVLRALAIGEV